MIVYRLEKNGEGPFYRKGGFLILPGEHEEADKAIARLKQNVDFTIKKHEDMADFYYGCNSLKKLYDYFGGLWRSAIRDGYRVKRYYVDRRDVRFSDSIELAFRKDGNYHEVPNYERYLP